MAGAAPRPQLTVPVIVGTRPEAIKLVPIILALRESECLHPVVVSTGQHHQMVTEVFALAGLATDVELWVGGARARLSERVATVMQRFDDFCTGEYGDREGVLPTREELLSGHYPAAVLVHGDTSSAMAAALAAFHLRIPVMHVEAGLRTGSNLSPFPEELNRELISRIACFHFAPTAQNEEHLVREQVAADQIFVTGNSGIDALHWAASLDVPYSDPAVAQAAESEHRIVVVTAHRRESWGGGLAGVAAGVARVARSHPDVRFVVSVHPNPRVQEELGEPLAGIENVVRTAPMGYAEFARLLRRAALVITDSGGIQEEAPSLDKPVLVARATTERTEGVAAGTLRLVGTDPERIAAEATRLLDDPDAHRAMASAHNPYGDGRAAERIVRALENLVLGDDPPPPFGSGYTREAVLTAAGYARALHPAEHPPEHRGVEEQAQPEAQWPHR